MNTAATLLTVKDLAALLNVGKRTIWKWRDGHRLPSPIKVGRVVRWRRADIESWIADGCPSHRPALSRTELQR